MVENKSVTIHVPATTANLGPGFDCLALALDLWNEVTVSFEGQRLNIEVIGEGEETLSQDETNLIFQAFALAARKYGAEIPKGVSIVCRNRIPISSGLGSSSSAIIAGLMAARSLFSLNLPDQQLLGTGLELEGHADNIAACLLGGLVIVIQDGEALITQKIKMNHLLATIALPQVQLSTRQSRKALPDQYSRQDAVFNIGHTAAVLGTLVSGDLSCLKNAMQDRIHQPYRLRLIPGSQAALDAAYDAGALGAALSGAGPSLIAFHSATDELIADAMQRSFDQEKIPVRLFVTSTIDSGAYIK